MEEELAEPSSGPVGHGQRSVRFIAFPFRSGPNEGDIDYLAYSLPEAIAATLAELNAFTVRSTQLAMRFDPMHWDPRAVAAEADVDVILTGTLERTGEQIHATTQLIDARSATVLWSKVWHIDSHDLFRFHSGVVELIVRSLVRSAPEHGEPPVGMDTPTASGAYELYLRANQIAQKWGPANMALARDLYVACTERDPNYAPAWARLGRCYRFLEKFGVQGDVVAGAAEKAFERAFQLNPHLAIAHSAYTSLQADKGHAQEAMVRLLKMLEWNENHPEIFKGLVQACRYCGQLDASLAAHERALRLDRNFRTSVAFTHFAMGDYEKAFYWYGTGSGLYLDILALACMGRLTEAAALLWTRRERFYLVPGIMISLEAYLEGDAAKGLAALLSSDSDDPEARFFMARQAARFGDLELAQKFLLQAVERGYFSSLTLTQDPWLEPLRTSTEFARTLSIVQQRERIARRAFVDGGGDRIFNDRRSNSAAGQS